MKSSKFITLSKTLQKSKALTHLEDISSEKASDLFVKCLESEGVEYIFGLPGEETNDIMVSLLNSNKIKF